MKKLLRKDLNIILNFAYPKTPLGLFG